MPNRSAEPLSPDWGKLADTLAQKRRWIVLLLLRFLNRRQSRPHELGLAHLLAYRDAILNDRLRGKPEKTWDALTWAWNACVREVSGWPGVTIAREQMSRSRNRACAHRKPGNFLAARQTPALPWRAR